MQQNIEIPKNPRPGSSVKTGKLFSTAEDLVKQGQLDQALKTLGRCTLLEPDSDRIYILRAEVYRQMRQYPLALDDLNHAINLNTHKPTAYIKRGEIYRALTKPREALLDLNQAIRLDPANSRALGQRGIIYRYFKEYYKSLIDFNRAIKLDPNNAWLYGNRAEIYRCLKDNPKAISDYNQVLKLNPAATWVYERRSYPYLWSGNLDRARSDFESAWKADSSNLMNGWMAEWLGMCRGGFTFTPEIKERLKSLANSNPRHYAAYLCRASLYWEHKVALKESYNQAETASLLMRDNPQAYFWQGMAAAGLGKNEEAYSLMQKALSLGISPALLSPMHWLEMVNPVFYKEYGQLLLANNAPGGNFPTSTLADVGPGINIDEQPSQAERSRHARTVDDEIENAGSLASQPKKTKSVLLTLLRICLLLAVGVGFAQASGSAPAITQFGSPLLIQGNANLLSTNTTVTQSSPTVTNPGSTTTNQPAGLLTGQAGKTKSTTSGQISYTKGLKQTGPTGGVPSQEGQTINNTGLAVTAAPSETATPVFTPGITNPGVLAVTATPQFQDVNPPKATNTPINLLKTRTPNALPTAVPTAKQPVNPLLPVPAANPDFPPQATPEPATVPTSDSNPAPTDTPVVGSTNTPLPSGIPTAAPTDTPVPVVVPTQVPTYTPVPTAMPTDTTAPTAVPTVPPSSKPIPTETPVPTVVPTDTPVPTAIPTDTPVPTAVPTSTPVPTDTPIPTVVPTSTPVPTAKPTPIPPPTKPPKPTRK